MGESNLKLGRCVATRGVVANLPPEVVNRMIRRHEAGDWGDLCREDKAANKRALKSGERVLSCYPSEHGKVYVITEWDRSLTTVLFAEEY